MSENRCILYTFMFCMLIFGTLNTIAGKAMDMAHSRGELFNHPYFQTAGMFLGEFFCIFYYFIYKKVAKLEQGQEPLKPKTLEKKSCTAKMGIFVFIIPAFFDFCGSTLMFVGLVLSAPSVYQMMRGFIMIVVALYSVVFLKIKLFKHQYLGVCFAFIGVILVGLASVLYGATSAKSPVLGVIIIIIAQFFAGGVFAAEQLFLENIVIHPLQAVGIEGMSGLGYYAIMLPVLNLIPCHNPDMCNGGYIENSIEALRQIGASWEIALLFIGFMLSISLFNFTGVTTTKKAGALARSTIDTSRTLLIWGFSMLVGWETFVWLQLVGFAFLVTGTLIYNEIVKVPFCGFTESIEQKKIYMRNRAEKKHQLTQEEEPDYLGYSPGAVYDQNHFKRKTVTDDIDLETKQ